MARVGGETARVRNTALHGTLEVFTVAAAGRLTAETAGGAEVPFELIEERAGGTPLYCYRSLAGEFIEDRLGLLTGLDTYAPAVRALGELESVVGYLQLHGESRIPSEPRERAETALRLFLGAVFVDRSQFVFDRSRFQCAYLELERSLYEGRCVNTVIAPLLGVALDRSGDRPLARDRLIEALRLFESLGDHSRARAVRDALADLDRPAD